MIPLGIGQHENPLASVTGFHLCRRKHSPFRIEPIFGQLREYPNDRRGKLFASVWNKEPWNVFEEKPRGVSFANDSPRVWPEVSRVGFKLSLSRDAVSLARDSRNDDIHDATPSFAVEG